MDKEQLVSHMSRLLESQKKLMEDLALTEQKWKEVQDTFLKLVEKEESK